MSEEKDKPEVEPRNRRNGTRDKQQYDPHDRKRCHQLESDEQHRQRRSVVDGDELFVVVVGDFVLVPEKAELAPRE